MTTIRVRRYNRQDGSNQIDQGFEEFVVNSEPGERVLDGLRAIQQFQDPTLAFRWECRAGICGTCAVMVNGKPCLSCEAELDPEGVVQIEPLAGFPVDKDLIVDFTPALERLRNLKPYLVTVPGEPASITKSEADRSKQFRRCIECFVCVASMTLSQPLDDKELDPLGIVKLARFASDPRDRENRILLAQAVGIEEYSPLVLRVASEVCPKHIDILAAFSLLSEAGEGEH